ncbi:MULTISPECIES: SCO family protein [Sporosarcina]|uniref:SCO family protein n=1 Tax=Sporosarcina TaxID=1569 RepID=UPI002559E1A7|nr:MULTISPECIES: SCO family protein [Sporosarcina]
MMKKKFLVLLTLIFVLVLSACGGGFKPDHKYKVEPFEFTNQDHEKVSNEDLKGEVWLAQFIFTVCEDACPPMMSNMFTLQKKLQEKNVEDYKVVAFSIDPETDTPEALKDYMEAFVALTDNDKKELGVDDQHLRDKWELLTGYDMKTIEKLAASSFKQVVKEIPNSNQVLHSVSFGLVNQDGEVVKLYDGRDDVPYDTIVKDMKALIKEGN